LEKAKGSRKCNYKFMSIISTFRNEIHEGLAVSSVSSHFVSLL